MMEYAVRLLGPSSDEEIVARFNEWANGPTLEIEN